MADRTGQQLGHYRLVRLLGHGGFAEVYLGEHLRLKTQAAVKVLYTRLASRDDQESFEKEARTVAHLKHPHIVRVLDYDIEDDTPFLVMDYAPGGTLRHRHPRGSILPLTTIISYIKQIADALQYAHDQHIIHRDVKPENMLVGEHDALLLSDFGIAIVALSSRYPSTQAMGGTVAYIAPEQIQGHPRAASDQYSLGIVAYEWICGDLPFHGSMTEIVAQHLAVPPPPLGNKVSMISPDVEQVVLTALAKDPKERFASVQAFATALEQTMQTIPVLQYIGDPQRKIQPNTITSSNYIYESLATSEGETLKERPIQQATWEPKASQESTSSLSDVKAMSAPKEHKSISSTLKRDIIPPTTRSIATIYPRKRKRQPVLVIALAMLLIVLLASGGIAYSVPGIFSSFINRLGTLITAPRETNAATLTITPMSQDLKNTYKILAITGTPDASRHQVGARLLSSTTPEYKQTATATGVGTVPGTGTHATGILTVNAYTAMTLNAGFAIYNLYPTPVHMMLDATVTLPSRTDVTVAAHVVEMGTIGNIPPEDGHGHGFWYSDSRLAAWNASSFTGGTNQQTYTFVQQSDIDGAANALIAAHRPNPEQVLQTQIHANEQPIGSPRCKPNISADHAAGDQASNVTVTVNFTCTGEVYDLDGALSMAAQQLRAQAAADPGPSYSLVGKIATMLTHAALIDIAKGIAALTISAEGVWVFQFNDTYKHQLAKSVAGKKKQEVQAFLLSQKGVKQMNIQLVGGDRTTFPTDVSRITVVVEDVS